MCGQVNALSGKLEALQQSFAEKAAERGPAASCQGLRLRLLLTELPFAPLRHHRSIVPNTWSQSVVLTP